MAVLISQYRITFKITHKHPMPRCLKQNNKYWYIDGAHIKAAVLQMLKKMRKKITVNTGQVMFSGEILYY